MKKILYIMAIAIAATIVSCSNKANSEQREAQELSGAGATFPQPFYNAVFELFSHKQGDIVAYGGIGSGSGVRNLRDKIVDFAGSDAFLSDEEMENMEPVIHIPTCMGAVVLAYNLDGIKDLKLSGDVIADIFAGVIKKWNDPRITTLNPGVKLPYEDIIPVYRSDGSGTTFVFTDYLSKVSKSWAKKYGRGKSVDFPVGQSGKGNPGVASVISNTKNTIGYIGCEYAFAQKTSFASIRNKCGEFVKPDANSISASASGDIPSDTRASITDSEAAGAYPISCFTWIIIYKEQSYSDRSKELALATLDLLQYILSPESQKATESLHYAPLPEKVKKQSMENLKAITYNGKTLLGK